MFPWDPVSSQRETLSRLRSYFSRRPFSRIVPPPAFRDAEPGCKIRAAECPFGTRFVLFLLTMMKDLILQPQAIPYDDVSSCCQFRPAARKPFTATMAAVREFGAATIFDCLEWLQQAAIDRHGLDNLQVFLDPQRNRELWFLDDGHGLVTALLPDDY